MSDPYTSTPSPATTDGIPGTTATTVQPTNLARTGTEVEPLLGFAGFLIVLGVIFLVAMRQGAR